MQCSYNVKKDFGCKFSLAMLGEKRLRTKIALRIIATSIVGKCLSEIFNLFKGGYNLVQVATNVKTKLFE